MTNTLYYGDNLDVMRRHLADGSVDLVYLDPPFNSGRDYNAIFKGSADTGQAQIKAFTDTWTWDTTAALALNGILKTGGKLANAMTAFQALLGDGSTLAYLAMMAPRLQEIRRVLKDTGSVYLHCDPSASHYLKILMDAIFGQKNFRNEIVWCYERARPAQKQFKRVHDILLFYSNSERFTFNIQRVASIRPRTPVKRPDGTYSEVSDGKICPSWWADIPSFGTVMNAPERLGYPTQKPLALLERIIKASSNPGDVVLDPFCGCGTAIDAAQGLGRQWIGIDITHLAVGVMKKRLSDRYGDACSFKVVGEPADLDGARQLASEDTHQFEHWALGLVGARASAKGKGGDKGIDGVLLIDDGTKVPQSIPISVKSGNVTSGMIRDLRGVMERDKAPIGIFVTLQEPSKGMRAEALTAGFYEDPNALADFVAGDPIPRIQIVTVQELLDGRKVLLPRLSLNTTLKGSRRT